MLELPHAVIGATIATKIGNPLLALPLAFLAHFLLDILPHWNPHIFTEMQTTGKVSKKSIAIIITDALLALIIGLFMAFQFWPDTNRVILILLGAFMGVLPDLVEAPYFFFHSKNQTLLKIIKFQGKIQWKASPIVGILTQIVVLLLCFFVLR